MRAPSPRWLTSKERALGLIDQHDSYRLPKDEEWSSWVRLTDEQGASPYEKTLPHENSREAFPWGYSWPPPDKTGNFADQSALIYLPSSRVIVGYNDGQPYTAPVKTFPPNHLGLYDLEGNVMEWGRRFLRGAGIPPHPQLWCRPRRQLPVLPPQTAHHFHPHSPAGKYEG